MRLIMGLIKQKLMLCVILAVGLKATSLQVLKDENKQLDEKIQSLEQQILNKGAFKKTLNNDGFEEEYMQRSHAKVSLKKRKKLLKLYSLAEKKSGVFLGGGYAYGEFNLSYQGEMLDKYGANASSVFKENILLKAPVSMISAKFGYQKYFVSYFGTRFYGDLLLGGGTLKETSLKQQIGSFFYALGAVNTDLLFDMPLDFKEKQHFLGVYAGFGIGLMLYQDKPNQNARNLIIRNFTSSNMLWKSLIEVDYTFNVGVSLTLFRKHRLEIGTKLPISYLRMGVEEGASYQGTMEIDGNKQEEKRLLISANNKFRRSSFLLVNYAYIF
ncbi:outer membrane beta-barrel protein [Helicobacter cetorum]|uniref:outer membrane beta-barrel protein n=1 Tax=Helicobacter cetorum TaxID=138563 RepID=UPI0018F7EF14|nr:outer membrane beta-barrel protein [Helicobacter cetorum]